jgi:hypothetical protein
MAKAKRKYYKSVSSCDALMTSIEFECPNTKKRVKLEVTHNYAFHGYSDSRVNQVTYTVDKCPVCEKLHTVYLSDY